MDTHIHKHGYAKLFQDPQLLKELIRDFVDPALAAQLDFSRLTIDQEKSYLSQEFRDFADDLFIQTRLRNREAYIAIILEFQSTSDRFMALRLLNYLTLFYLDYIGERRRKNQMRREKGLPPKPIGKLPPVLPLVLYNGTKPWRAPSRIEELIEDNPHLQAYCPRFQYIPVIEHDHPPQELIQLGTGLAAVFLLENLTPDQMDQYLAKLKKNLDNEEAGTVQVIFEWVNHLLKNGRIPPSAAQEVLTAHAAHAEKTERRNTAMFPENFYQSLEYHEKRGEQKGIAIGEKRGEQRGEKKNAATVAKLMLQKHYPLKEIQAITGLTTQELEKLEKDLPGKNPR